MRAAVYADCDDYDALVIRIRSASNIGSPSMTRFGLHMTLLCLLLACGCSRNHYRLRADQETLATLDQKTACAPWSLPGWFSIDPHPESRYAVCTNPNDPELPVASTRLYAYQMPDLPERDPARYGGGAADMLQPLGTAGSSEALALRPIPRRSPTAIIRDAQFRAASYIQAEELPLSDPRGNDATGDPSTNAEDNFPSPYSQSADSELIVVPIPAGVWNSLPASCLDRMMKFDSVRQEYARTFDRVPSDADLEDTQKLALEDIVDVALINSREYQRQKELLYLAALDLTLERFAYDVKFDPFGQGTDANYIHNRSAGITVNTLGVPTRFSGSKLLATGGTLVGSFANDVVLTFNGPGGFSSDIGSELFFSLSQSIFQRDIVLESLTQSERNVIYAARDFARFRKLFFQDLANQYYSLLLTYRGIEIDSQDYFSNLRAFNQGQAEFDAGSLPRLQVDQFEQNALRSRSNLIGRCNSLESSLDNLKFNMGIPPELPLNLDLTELELLTLRDEATVSAELARRALRNLIQERESRAPDRNTLLNFAIDLTQRMINLRNLRSRLGELEGDADQLQFARAEFLVDEARILVEQNDAILRQERAAVPPSPPLRIFQRTTDLIDSQLILVRQYGKLAALNGMGTDQGPTRGQAAMLAALVEELRTDLLDTIERRELEQIPQLVARADALLEESTALMEEAAPGMFAVDAERDLERIIERVDQLLAVSREAISQRTGGLVPIKISVDDAMLTALAQRFDLMNQRGSLADSWRRIKLAGDDLKSVLNLSGSQSIRTDSTNNRAFDFTLDDSTTRLNMSFDLPLNRKAQRNRFRESLINYQLGLRNLIALEDSIKLTIRDDLRDLQLDREQYDIAVASAALAYERVLSTRLQLQLGVEDVAARDFLEAQQAYTASLSSVAGEHIGYVTDRIALFVDLELLEVDENGFWPGLYDEALQPEVNIAPPCADGPYGQLPAQVWHTKQMRRMLHVPYGAPISFDPDAVAEPELLPTPSE